MRKDHFSPRLCKNEILKLIKTFALTLDADVSFENLQIADLTKWHFDFVLYLRDHFYGYPSSEINHITSLTKFCILGALEKTKISLYSLLLYQECLSFKSLKIRKLLIPYKNCSRDLENGCAKFLFLNDDIEFIHIERIHFEISSKFSLSDAIKISSSLKTKIDFTSSAVIRYPSLSLISFDTLSFDEVFIEMELVASRLRPILIAIEQNHLVRKVFLQIRESKEVVSNDLFHNITKIEKVKFSWYKNIAFLIPIKKLIFNSLIYDPFPPTERFDNPKFKSVIHGGLGSFSTVSKFLLSKTQTSPYLLKWLKPCLHSTLQIYFMFLWIHLTLVI